MKHCASYICGIAKFKALIITVALVICALMASAQTEKYIQSLTGNIKKDDSCVVTDDKFRDSEKWATIEKQLSVNNLVTFELRYDTAANYFNRKFSCTLLVDIDYENAGKTKQQLKNVSLEVNFDTTPGSTHQGIAFYKFKDGHRVKITVKKISSAAWGKNIPPIFRIKNEIFVERLYTLNTKDPIKTVVTGSSIDATEGSNIAGVNNQASRMLSDMPGQQQTISWDITDASFPQYDFEWTFYDDSSLVGKAINSNTFTFSPAELAAVFKNNSSRVTVNLPSYQLNLIYNKGWLFHRVRGVRYDETTGERTTGTWSYAGEHHYNGALYGLVKCEGHEEYLNWQYSMSFAEEGKRKEVVSYFDGSLRNRQAVTLNNDNTGSKTIVQENVFDALGRAAVNILPSPTEENTIHYFHEFNKSAASNLPYSFTDIEAQNNCFKQPLAMSTASGASQYYSPANPKKDDNGNGFYFTKYIPDAQGYPFAVTSFTPDNTGRVRTQGGVGPVYQPGKAIAGDDHTTRYFYGKPQQDELDRLFGNEAGNASHYLKNMVIDANGQTSVSYTNASGKTVATALAGKTPDNLQSLPSYQLKNVPFVTTLTDRDNILRDAAGLSLTYSGTFLAAATGNFTLQYEFTPLSLQVLYGVENNKICADCYYDLLINVTDNCGNSVQSVNQEAVFTEKTTCNPAPTKQEGQLPVTIQQPGEYNITYKLTLSRKAIDYYITQYLVQDLSLKKEIDFQREYIHKIDISGCFTNCQTCLADLGTEQNFVARMTGVLQQQDSITANDGDIVWMKELYKKLLDECSLQQQGCGKTEMPCEEQTLQLKDDVTLGGQYMQYDALTNLFTGRDINIFLKNKASLKDSITIKGVIKPFNQFSEQAIIANWQDAWADILLPWHPENSSNCLIADCGKNAANDLYDRDFLNTEDAAAAATKLYWFGDNYLFVVNNDPYFKSGAEGASKKTAFINSLNNYKGTGKDIMNFVRWTVYCQDKSADVNKAVEITTCPRTVACNREGDEWSLFKTLYYGQKQKIESNGSSCNSSALFPDPTAVMQPVLDQNAAVPLSCTDAAFFEISNNAGTVTIQYTGTQKITQDISVQYFSVTNTGVIVNQAGSVVFPAGTEADAVKTVPGNTDLTYVIDFARCDLSHPYYSKTRRNYNGVNMTGISSLLTSKSKEQLTASTLAAMVNECNESCEQNADGWMQKLAGCHLTIDEVVYAQIRDGLLAVCKSSCQVNVQDHPFGASSTTLATKEGDKNFRDVLLRVLGEEKFSALCNDLFLDYPAPVNAMPLYTNEVVRTLQPCAYDKLKAWRLAYQAATGYDSFAAFIKKTIDPDFTLSDAELTSLINASENNCVTPHPLRLPASLSCTAAQPKTCLTCQEMQDEQLNFATAYSYVSTSNPGYYVLLAKYINKKYAFNLSSADVYNALQQCTVNGKGEGIPTDTIQCGAFTAALSHFEQLRPDYFSNPQGNLTADSLYKIQLTLWLNTELNRQLSFDYYNSLAIKCGISFNYPGSRLPLACDTSFADCIPQFISCCAPFAELERFRQVFADSVNARLLAVYFSMQRTQWCTPVNLPNISYALPYDSIVGYFNNFKLASAYKLVVRPDSLISYTADYTGACNATALIFNAHKDAENNALAFAICNKPVQPSLATGDNSCINQQVSVSLGNAHRDYLEYMVRVRRDYRNAYYIKCLSITPQLKLEAVYNQPLEYHYTLYYYDQSGNLVKTIPPAGVQPVDEETNGADRMLRVKNFRLSDKDYCYEYGDAPAMNGSASITLGDNPSIQQTTQPFTAEAFVNFSSLAGSQTILAKQSTNTADNKTDGYKIYINDGRLMVDMAAHGQELWLQTLAKITQYTFPSPYAALTPVTVRSKVQVQVPRNLYRSVTAQITSDISGLIGSNQWAYIAIQNTGDWNNPVRIYINGNLVSSQLLTNNYDYTPATPPALTPADIAAGTTVFSFDYYGTTVPLNVNNNNNADLVIGALAGGLTGSIKQVRIYNRALPATEIRSNAFNTCLVPQSEGQLVVWLPLNKEETSGISIDRVNQLTTINSNTSFSNLYQPVYPVHKMPTNYYYNSLNGVTMQKSPDGGQSNFFYDLLGRLVVSQNAEQKNSTRGETNNRYSYTKYDVLGRITEVGEKVSAATMTTAIAKTDPTITTSAINKWLLSGTNIQITQTIYDQPDANIVANTNITSNQNIYNTARKRVVASIYRNTNTAGSDYNSATHYQYDINGNVKRLWQEQKKSVTGSPINLLKDLQYDYDLVSGKVNHVIYQKGKGDQFIYKYEYDPDNRLLRAYSGRDMNTLQQDAGYRYYLHGPLARMELGDALTNRIVQGSDYVYTLQGWLKGVNGVQLNAADGDADAGADGTPLSKAGIHAQVSADALAYTLGYYQNDYTPIGGAAVSAFGIQYQHPVITGNDATGKALFNGNISNATYSIAGIDNGSTRGYSYGYDQLNRLKEMRAHDLSATATGAGWNNSSIFAAGDNKESFSYDANGNIVKLFRNGTASAGRKLAMDDLSYTYYYYTLANARKTYTAGQPLPADAWQPTNQLAHVKDAVPVANYPATAYPEEKDIDNQANNNYTYDRIGNLVKDNAEGISAIGWTVYGKIRSIVKTDGTSIIYDYDASGNRIQKQVVSGDTKTITSYIRDARGNTIAVYSWKGSANASPVAAETGNGLASQTWDEQHLYGSSRLGMWRPNITVPAILNPTADAVQVGSKFFELTSHLGNVLAVISDNKIAVRSRSNPLVTDHYAAEIISANDYTPFGMQMAGRAYSVASSSYRYGFNGKENDNEVKGEGNQQDYGMRIYDPRLGRFLSVDPISKSYPELTPYQFASNSPISGIDLDGLEYVGTMSELPSRTIKEGVANSLYNVIAKGWNGIAGLWNGGVDLAKNASKTDLGTALVQVPQTFYDNSVRPVVNYTTKTPAKQQLKDAIADFKNPQVYFEAFNNAVVIAATWKLGTVESKPAIRNVTAESVVEEVETVKNTPLVQTEVQQWQSNAGGGQIQKLQAKLEELAESKLLPEFRKEDPNLNAGYTGSFKTGRVGNRDKLTFGQPINLNSYDIDFWIESDILLKKYGKGLKANIDFRKILSATPGFEGLRPNKDGFSIKFKPSRKK